MREEPPADGDWHRLHPLSPVVRSGRGVLAVLAALGVPAALTAPGVFGSPVPGGGGHGWYDVAGAAAVAAAAVVNWLVTRWRMDEATLRIESGLLRRDSRQLPIARIQAVDLVRPFLARALGLAELRVRLAGSSHADGRLAYLPEHAAIELRSRLLAGHPGTRSGPAAGGWPEQVAVVVPTGRLVGSVMLFTGSLAGVAAVAGLLLALATPAGLAAAAGALAWWLVIGVPLVWRRVSAQYGFTVAESAGGISIRRGLLETVAETIPVPRVQAVRLIEPLLWRPLGWRRLEVDVAGSPGRDKDEGASRARKVLLPVGRRDDSLPLLEMVMGNVVPVPARPPPRACWKAPLSYHFLAAGHDSALAAGVTGRFRRITTWVPLEKAQSVRFVQGPVQRRLGLATVHLDAAGRRVRAEFRERSEQEARLLVSELAALCRTARRRASLDPPGAAVPGAAAAPVPPATGQPLPGTVHAATVGPGANEAQSEA